MSSEIKSINSAEFHREMAVKALGSYNYGKAVKHLRRAAEIEPTAHNLCDLAGALAESGKYPESNEILNRVLTEIDPNMTECFFYMANNFANMEMWDESEAAIIKYLENDAAGDYVSECEDMLSYFTGELHREPVKIGVIKSQVNETEHEKARELLSIGEYPAAIEVLENIIASDPDFLPARNNLAIAYIYSGKYAEADEQTNYVLERDSDNVYALCNKAIILNSAGNEEKLHELIDYLVGFKPENGGQIFKLAATMGSVGRDDIAYRLFRSIVKEGYKDIYMDSSFYHYMAVAAWNLGYIGEAKKTWAKAKKLEPESKSIEFYSFISNIWETHKDRPPVKFDYKVSVPVSAMLKTLHEQTKHPSPDSPSFETFMAYSFTWLLNNAEPEVRKLVVEGLRLIDNKEVNKGIKSRPKLNPTETSEIDI